MTTNSDVETYGIILAGLFCVDLEGWFGIAMKGSITIITIIKIIKHIRDWKEKS